MTYSVDPGLYAVGDPDPGSDVLVTANYKLSFDILRRSLTGQNAWILVLDTKSINVWCAAGKGTFGTEELIGRVASVELARVVTHRRLIVPQLGAPGIHAHTVKKETGFRVYFGPVDARDIAAYLRAGYKASREMRLVRFSLVDRFVLTPMEVNPAMRKFPLYALAVLLLFGLQPEGILFEPAWLGGLPFLMLGLGSIFSGAFVTPLLLPWVPGRSFGLKGWITGMVAVSLFYISGFGGLENTVLLLLAFVFFPMLSSYLALQFTGSTTFTSKSGVEKELRTVLPVYLTTLAISLVLIIVYKIGEWGIL
jgi:hypothetical protein